MNKVTKAVIEGKKGKKDKNLRTSSDMSTQVEVLTSGYLTLKGYHSKTKDGRCKFIREEITVQLGVCMTATNTDGYAYSFQLTGFFNDATNTYKAWANTFRGSDCVNGVNVVYIQDKYPTSCGETLNDDGVEIDHQNEYVASYSTDYTESSLHHGPGVTQM